MLKPRDPEGPDDGERPVGEIVQQLVDDGKAYARAEIELGKARAYAKWDEADRPLAIVAAGFICGQAAVICIAVGLYSVFAQYIGPLAAGLASGGLFGVGAFLLFRNGYAQLKDIL